MPNEKQPFPPGESRNPGGRPKRTPEIRAALKEGGIKGLRKAIDLIDSEDERIALDASKYVVDQAIGKALQEITGEDGAPLFAVNGDVLRLEVMRALQRFAAPPPVDTTAIVLPALPEPEKK